ncbi:NAD-dependent epimerase/dehydratase family protein [Acidipropionibacterium acidipropionici]|uniref:NAD-dependent epimerase/dehydratase family protein n=1 Tax=Acidipropionibacterium acidipropionici TaxID=1748 RepID=UPI00110A0D95|nr:NAD(P)-dependent oxidoreductase [Acidipropionibacterium acidipropionici]QCV96043.1 NAD(P)-dependent oxidoreductase [Acidipropionibacterium acidipropionici]
MRVLITGGAGFIGRRVASAAPQDWQLTAVDILHPQVHADIDADRAAFPGAVVEKDVADPRTWRELDAPDLVIHLAAETGTAQSMYETDRYTRVNVEGTRLAVRAACAWGVPVIATSSRAVYGGGRWRLPDGTVEFGVPTFPGAVPEDSRETDDRAPASVYGRTKSQAEEILTEAAAEIPVTIFRPQNVIGPGQALHNPYTGVLAAWLAMLKEHRPITVYGDGSQTRDFIHVDDLAAMVLWAAQNPPEPGSPRVLNAGSGVRTTLTELAHYCIDGSPEDSDPGITHVDVTRAGDIDHACADMTLARELGAPAPRWSTADAVADFIVDGWDQPGARASAWDDALEELAAHGMTGQHHGAAR